MQLVLDLLLTEALYILLQMVSDPMQPEVLDLLHMVSDQQHLANLKGQK